MKIKVLGTGCARCKQLYAEVEKALVQFPGHADLEKVEKLADILDYGVMMMPALVIDNAVKAEGRIPKSAEIVSWIAAASEDGG